MKLTNSQRIAIYAQAYAIKAATFQISSKASEFAEAVISATERYAASLPDESVQNHPEDSREVDSDGWHDYDAARDLTPRLPIETNIDVIYRDGEMGTDILRHFFWGPIGDKTITRWRIAKDAPVPVVEVGGTCDQGTVIHPCNRSGQVVLITSTNEVDVWFPERITNYKPPVRIPVERIVDYRGYISYAGATNPTPSTDDKAYTIYPGYWTAL